MTRQEWHRLVDEGYRARSIGQRRETMIRDWMLTEGADRSKPALVAYCEARIAEGRKSATKAARASHYAAQRHFAKGSKR